jgi:catechol 2,3-dioxygenase-like lactoylglutathione lyase family enzyme
MLDHVFISVTNLKRSIDFYERTLAPLGISHVIDYDGAHGPAGHPDLKGFGRDGRVAFWLRLGNADAGAADQGAPGACLHYDPRYYAANVLDPDGYSLEAVYKSWQHPQP